LKTLVYLGLVNAWRNLGRSLLAVLAMGLAAMLMTGSLTLGEGYTAQRAWEYRAYLGGDILVYPDWTWPTESNVAGAPESGVGLSVLPRHFGSPLLYFHPDYYTTGYLTADDRTPSYSMFTTAAEMDRTMAGLTAHEGILWAEPYRSIPVMDGRLEIKGTGPGKPVSLAGFYLRSCPPNLLTQTMDDYPDQIRLTPRQGNHSGGEMLADKKTWESGVYVAYGSPLSGLGDEPLALVNRRAVIPRGSIRTQSVDLSGSGQTVVLTVPAIVPGDSGEGRPPYFDFSRPVTVEIKVVGAYDAATRLLSWVPGPGVSYHEQPGPDFRKASLPRWAPCSSVLTTSRRSRRSPPTSGRPPPATPSSAWPRKPPSPTPGSCRSPPTSARSNSGRGPCLSGSRPSRPTPATYSAWCSSASPAWWWPGTAP